MLSKVKTDNYDIELVEWEILHALNQAEAPGQAKLLERGGRYNSGSYLRDWFAPQALEELASYQAVIENYRYQDVLK